jgi:ankyrin repeat protein
MTSLLEHGANPNTEEPCDNASLLQLASEKGCYDIVDLLIKYKADVNQRDCFGNTPLMVACRNGNLDVVELLLER